jgi:hypothetical protein
LQRELGYARATIAKALHLLTEEGLIYQPLGLPYDMRGGGYQPHRIAPRTLTGPDRSAKALISEGDYGVLAGRGSPRPDPAVLAQDSPWNIGVGIGRLKRGE